MEMGKQSGQVKLLGVHCSSPALDLLLRESFRKREAYEKALSSPQAFFAGEIECLKLRSELWRSVRHTEILMSEFTHVTFLIVLKPLQKQLKGGRVYFSSQFEDTIHHGGQSLAAGT